MRRRAPTLLVALALLTPGSLAHAAAHPATLAAQSATAAPTPLTAPAPATPTAAGKPAAPKRRVAPRKPGRTVRGALRRARLAGHLGQREHDALRRRWRDAERLAARLPGARGTELRHVLAGVDDLARRGRLSAGRLPLAFLTIRRNAFALSERPLGTAKQRTTFGRDPLVWQFYPGHGWQLQALATAGRANALARVCLEAQAAQAERVARAAVTTRRTGDADAGPPAGRVLRGPLGTCRPAALAATLDRLLAVSSRRGSFRAWELPFAFGGARPGWISGMTQATAVQALVRGAAVLQRPALRDAAREALGAFERRPPVGVALPQPGGGRFYLLYSDLPGLRVFNAHLQALIGLREAAQRGLSARAGRVFRRGQAAARTSLPGADTGAWSLYSDGGRESDLGYHRLVGGFLRELCRQTHRGLYCAARERFARYEREPPRIHLDRLPALRPGRLTHLAIRLSKVARVRVTVASRRGAALDVGGRLGRGRHVFAVRPPTAGRYRVRVVATGLSGPRAAAVRDVVVRPKRKPGRTSQRRSGRQAKRTGRSV
ncbi:D-glucuronyl C5-epimerase family protein [Conexibacter sp. SYSU D00693]|uniref:D-glucuronyl C5-epimerase family protein n=1 Tax=Conexibacter sp. SYSU D00693 TaxID=2812560 RepID=UPI00196ACD64|nr:D-glucuronyl C5-epimerase family protein [Conexibacter sp. SYSU D00693]